MYFNETQFKMYAEIKPFANTQIGSFFRIGKQIDYANTQLGDGVLVEALSNGMLTDILMLALTTITRT